MINTTEGIKEQSLADESKAITEQTSESTGYPSIWRELWEVIETILLALILYFAIDAVFARVRVENISMLSTLREGDVLVVNKLAYKWGNYETGDIVVFHNPNFLEEDFIKRLIGKPGDWVVVQDGHVYVNDVMLDESYLDEPPEYEGEWLVPSDAIFVLGDNRNESSDSHSWGYVPLEDVVGKALFVYWPWDAMTILENPYK
jgi:signal peptidase I